MCNKHVGRLSGTQAPVRLGLQLHVLPRHWLTLRRHCTGALSAWELCSITYASQQQ